MNSVVQRPYSVFSYENLEDPYTGYAMLRERAPVYFDELQHRWVVMRYEAACRVLKDAELFSSRKPLSFFGPSAGASAGSYTPLFSDDPPKHTRLKSLINRTFTSSSLAATYAWVSDKIAMLLEGAPAAQFDIVKSLTVPLPVMIIAKLLGVDVEAWPQLKLWTDIGVGGQDTETRRPGRKAYLEMYGFFKREIDRRRVEPADDIIGILTRASASNEHPMSDLEIMHFCIMLLMAGNETTSNLLCNMVNIVARRPELWERLRADRSLIKGVVEESLRFDSPAQFVNRIATADTEIGESLIKAGEMIAVCLGSANRDPLAFGRPDEFIHDRQNNNHLAFSHGIHFCVGALLSRKEAALLLNEMLDRYRAIKLSADGERSRNISLRGFSSLTLDLTPAT